jgi:hypothetical protein
MFQGFGVFPEKFLVSDKGEQEFSAESLLAVNQSLNIGL